MALKGGVDALAGDPGLAGAAQVGAGAEAAARAGQDRDPKLAPAERIQGGVHAVDQRSVDRVQPLRPVQGDESDLVLESCEFHCSHTRTVSDTADVQDAAYRGFAAHLRRTMTRTEGDTWDLASSVGATATMVAAARAAATRRPQPVITDRVRRAAGARGRVGPVHPAGRRRAGSRRRREGRRLSADGRHLRRSRPLLRRLLRRGQRRGLRQVVIVASGLDSRAYRLSWPAGTTVYEIDQPEVIEFKTATLSETRRCARRRAPHGGHRPARRLAGRAAGRPASIPRAPTAWLAEGVLIGFLPPEAEVRLLDNVIALSAAGSRFAADFGSLNQGSPEAQEQARIAAEGWRRQGLDLDIAGLGLPR